MSRCVRPRGTIGYTEDAEEVFNQYERVRFEDVHKGVLDLYPKAASQVLDVGAGSGRDAAALARYGHFVTAVEPTKSLLTKAQKVHASANILWINDHLPELKTLRGKEHSFALIILSAVWMHLDSNEQFSSMHRLAELLAPTSLLSISLRHGPVPNGRVMFDVNAEDVCTQARENGLLCVRQTQCLDPLGRAEVYWSILAFSGPMN